MVDVSAAFDDTLTAVVARCVSPQSRTKPPLERIIDVFGYRFHAGKWHSFDSSGERLHSCTVYRVLTAHLVID